MLFMAIFLSMGMAYMAASFISFLVQERSSKVRAEKRRHLASDGHLLDEGS